nr:MAG: capsid protein [Cressdnaviricota sp.]
MGGSYHGSKHKWQARVGYNKHQGIHGHASFERKTHLKPQGGFRIKADDLHSGVSTASYKILVGKPKKRVDYKSGVFHYEEITAGRFAQPAGLQSCNVSDTVGSTAEWAVAGGTAGNHFGTGNIAVSLFSLNSGGWNGGSALWGSSTRIAGDKLYLSSCSLKMSVANFSSVNASVWIYICESVRNHNNPPNALWTSDSNVENVGGTLANITEPTAGNQTGGNVGYSNIVIPYSNPQTLKEWKKFWRVKKVHRADLAGGAQEDVDFHLKMNMMGDMAKIINSNVNYTTAPSSWTAANITTQYQTGSITVMVIAKGGVVRDTTGGADTVTTASTSIGVVSAKTYTLYPVQDNSARLNASAMYAQIPFSAAVGVQQHVDVNDASAGNVTA